MKKNSSRKQFLSKIAYCFQGLLILTVIWASGPAHVFAQSAGKTVTIHAKNQTVRNLLQEIQKQTGINFAYNEKILSSYTSRTLEVTGQSVGKALQLLFEETDLTYSIDGNTVTIYRKIQHQAVGHKRSKVKSPMSRVPLYQALPSSSPVQPLVRLRISMATIRWIFPVM